MLAELERLAADIDREPATVGQRAEELLCAARTRGDQACVVGAATLVARAKRDLRQMEAAEVAIESAIADASGLGGDVLADAHMVAASIASHRSGPDDVAAHLAAARRHASPALRWKVGVQQAILSKRNGDLDGALGRYDDVIDDLHERGDTIVLARVLSNRGNVRGLRGDLSGAITDYRSAIDLFEQADQEFAVAIVTQNLAEATARSGDAPTALTLLDDAACRLDRLGQPMHDATTAKAEALIAVGLFSDAIEILEPAVRSLLADGDRTGAAEAALVQAEARRLAGEPSRKVAERAQQIFTELGLDGFAAQSELEVVRSAAVDDGVDPDPASTAVAAGRLADELRSKGAVRAAIDALALATTRALASGDVDMADGFATRCEELAADLPFIEHRLAAAHARTAVADFQGESRTAIETIEAVLDEFDHYRATIGAPDGRRGSAVHAAGLEALGARLVAQRHDPVDLLVWSEQRRCNHQRLAHRQRPMSTAGQALVHELRSVLAELRHDGDTDGAPELLQRRSRLERELRENEVRHRGDRRTNGAERSSCGDIDAAAVRAMISAPVFDSHVGVSVDVHGDELIGLVIHRGTTRRVALGSTAAARKLANGARTVLSDAALPTRPDGRAADRYRRATEALDRFLAPLELPDGPVALALPMDLQAVQWCASTTLRSRPVTVAPSLTAWVRNERAAPACVRPSIAAVAGPRLDHAHAEVAEVLRCYGASGSVATDLSTALDRADVVHVAAHTRLRSENPLWSTIEVDGGPIEAHRFVGTEMRPSLVVLSTCDSAVPTGHPSTAFAGFASLLVSGGVDSAVATVGALPDAGDTVAVMRTFHEQIVAGVRPAEALATARVAHPESIAADGFMCWGAG